MREGSLGLLSLSCFLSLTAPDAVRETSEVGCSVDSDVGADRLARRLLERLLVGMRYSLIRGTVLFCLVGFTVSLLGGVASAQPTPPMVLDGYVFIEGERAPQGTLVEVSVAGEVKASTGTEAGSGGRQGYYVLGFRGEDGDEVRLLVDGAAADILVEGEEVSSIPYESGATPTYDLIVGTSPATVVLTLEAAEGGQTDPPVGDHVYPDGSEVTIRAIPSDGWAFDGWIGDVSDPDTPLTTVTLDGDRSVTATFRRLPPPTISTPSPTPTATDGPSPTPSPTATPSPTPSASPTAEPTEPGASPTPTSASTSEEATPTVAATATSEDGEPEDTGLPTATATVVPEESGSGTGDEPTPTLTPVVIAGDAAPTAVEDVLSSPAPTAAEPGDDEAGGGPSILVVGAVVLALVGAAAIGLGVWGLRGQTEPEE